MANLSQIRHIVSRCRLGVRWMYVCVEWASRPLIEPYSPEMLAIVRSVLPQNRALGITGALYFTETAFFQVIEGTPSSVEIALGRIRADKRHADVTVIDTQSIPERLFGAHDMKFVDGVRHRITQRPLDFDTLLRLDKPMRRDLTLAMLRA